MASSRARGLVPFVTGQLALSFLLCPGLSCSLLIAGEGKPVGSSSRIPTNGAFHLRKIMRMSSLWRGVRSNSRSQQGLGKTWRSWSLHTLTNVQLIAPSASAQRPVSQRTLHQAPACSERALTAPGAPHAGRGANPSLSQPIPSPNRCAGCFLLPQRCLHYLLCCVHVLCKPFEDCLEQKNPKHLSRVSVGWKLGCCQRCVGAGGAGWEGWEQPGRLGGLS